MDIPALVDVDALVAAGLTPEMAQQVVRTQQIQHELLERDPSLGVITSHVIAQDLASLERVEAEVAAGEFTPEEGLHLVGSYARLEYAVKHLPHDAALYKRLPDLWRDADPDDSDPTFEALWRDAWEWNGRKPLHDERAMKQKGTLTLWRGEDRPDLDLDEEAEPTGIAWTLDFAIADKFARGAGLRQRSREGVVLTAEVPATSAYAFITGRGESEVVVPRSVVKGAWVCRKWHRVTPEFRQELEDIARGL